MTILRSPWGLGATLLALALAAPAGAAEFFAGKQMQIVVSTEAGTAYDVQARLLADHLVNHIPGKPRMIVQNMPGASGLKVANFIYNVAPKDGTVIGATHSSVPTAALLSPEGAQYDAKKLRWLGSITKDPFVAFLWYKAPVQKWEEFYTKEVTLGTQAVGSASADYAILANALLGTKIKNVFGYKSAPEVRLAVEKGEIMGGFGTAYSSLKSQVPDWFAEKKIILPVQHGLSKHPDLPDVPLLIDQTKNPEDRQLLELVFARQEFGKPYFLPPEVPADRLAVLRKAFDDTMKDPAYVGEVKKAGLDVDGPMSGQEMEVLVGHLMETSPAIIARIDKIFDDFRKGQK